MKIRSLPAASGPYAIIRVNWGCSTKFNAMRERPTKVPILLISYERGAIKTLQIRCGGRDVLSGIKKELPKTQLKCGMLPTDE